MFRWLVSAGFLALPIGATIGVLLAIQALRSAHGQPPPFSGGDLGGDLPGTGVPRNRDSVQMWCDEAYGFDPKSKGVNFILNPNPWGWQKGDPGAQCMQVEYFGNKTYATPYSAPPFNITWQYTRATDPAKNVHGFPNAKLDSNKLPAQLGSITKMQVGVEWHMSLANDSATAVSLTKSEVSAKQINANVAIDMFLHQDQARSLSSEQASHEVMVWFADFGTDTWPIGKTAGADKGVKATQTIGDATFELYAGQNSLQQTVLSWVSTTAVETFNQSLTPLFDAIFALNDASFPKKTDYLGYFAFGQETYWSPQNVTFSVPQLAVNVETS